jgi:hypothetical protein
MMYRSTLALLFVLNPTGAFAADPVVPEPEIVLPERLCLTANPDGQIIEMKDCTPQALLQTERLLEELKKPVSASAN